MDRDRMKKDHYQPTGTGDGGGGPRHQLPSVVTSQRQEQIESSQAGVNEDFLAGPGPADLRGSKLNGRWGEQKGALNPKLGPRYPGCEVTQPQSCRRLLLVSPEYNQEPDLRVSHPPAQLIQRNWGSKAGTVHRLKRPAKVRTVHCLEGPAKAVRPAGPSPTCWHPATTGLCLHSQKSQASRKCFRQRGVAYG